MTSWVSDIRNALVVRDKFEKADSPYHEAFMALNQQLQLHQSFSRLQGMEESQSMMSSIERDSVLKEDIRLKHENQELINSLNRATLNSERLESILKGKQSDIRRQDRKISKLKESVDNLKSEIKEKDKLVNFANEEILSRNLELHMSKSSYYDLEQENLKLKRKINELESSNDYLEKNLALVTERLKQVTSQ